MGDQQNPISWVLLWLKTQTYGNKLFTYCKLYACTVHSDRSLGNHNKTISVMARVRKTKVDIFSSDVRCMAALCSWKQL